MKPPRLFCAAIWAVVLALPAQGASEAPALEKLPGTQPLIKRTYRPPNYESPIRYFNSMFTPNDRFFVRYHLANIPQVDVKTWKLEISGDSIAKPISWTMEELKKNFEEVEIPAVAVCAGNRRGLFEPHVPGVQWGPGAMGNAIWKGVRLKDVLARAGLKPDAIEVVFDGADAPLLPSTPDFVKSLPLDRAMDENTLIAFEMNGKPLPHLQGFPARLVVPGWAATYWMKHLVSIRVVNKPFDGFWMKSAYRIPKGKFPAVEGGFPTQTTATNTPITELIVNSMATNIREKQTLKLGKTLILQGLAWDGGHGIEKVEVTEDGGLSWRIARLKKDYGRFSWRQFAYAFKPEKKADYTLMVRATNTTGQAQPLEATANPAGYHNNAIQKIQIHVD